MTYAGSIAFEGKFPDGSTSKGANPAIWTDMPDFQAKTADFKKDAKHAVDNLPTSLDQLKTVRLKADHAKGHPYRFSQHATFGRGDAT